MLNHNSCESGSGTALGLMVAMTAIIVLLLVSGVGGVATGKATARTAAEQGALAGARRFDQTRNTADSCDAAGDIVVKNNAELSSCTFDGDDIFVIASVPILASDGASVLAPLPAATARARAGPVDCPS